LGKAVIIPWPIRINRAFLRQLIRIDHHRMWMPGTLWAELISFRLYQYQSVQNGKSDAEPLRWIYTSLEKFLGKSGTGNIPEMRFLQSWLVKTVSPRRKGSFTGQIIPCRGRRGD
jgi:hypothetical protein